MATSQNLDRPVLFIGSSSEGRDIARNLQEELVSLRICEVIRWDQGVFEASGYTIDSLVNAARDADFAVLVATPDDVITTRGAAHQTVRDNVIFEFGLFIGALGRQRTYLLATGSSQIKLPSDLQGLTRLPFDDHAGGSLRAALNGAALAIEQQVRAHGPRLSAVTSLPGSAERRALEQEVELVCESALAQGWRVKSNSETTLRLRSPRGVSLTFSKGRPTPTRIELRHFVSQLRAAGLRVSAGVRRPVEDSPFAT